MSPFLLSGEDNLNLASLRFSEDNRKFYVDKRINWKPPTKFQDKIGPRIQESAEMQTQNNTLVETESTLEDDARSSIVCDDDLFKTKLT